MEYVYIYSPLVLLVIEFFLGQTDLVKANSTIALVLDIGKKILGIFKK